MQLSLTRRRALRHRIGPCPSSPPPCTAPAKASRWCSSTASPPPGAAGCRCSACWSPRFEVIAPTLHGHDGGPVPPHAAHSLAHATDHFEPLLDELGVGHRALRRQLDGRGAGARAGQARPRAQRRGDLARRRLGGGRLARGRADHPAVQAQPAERRAVTERHHERLLAPARLPPHRDARHHDPRAPDARRGGRAADAVLHALQRRRGRLRDDARRLGRASSTSTR